MTEEIKEIFYKLRSDEYYEEHYQQSVYYEKDLNKLENHITNLQKENERIGGLYEAYEEANNLWIKECDDYKSRNEKAVEYLEHFDSNQICENITEIAKCLLNILKGSDE